MAFIPFDKMKSLREAAKNGDVKAKKILIMQMNGEDFGSSMDEYFTKPDEPAPLENGNNLGETDEKLAKFLEYNGVKPGDIDYNETVEAYYKEFPKARPATETKATEPETESDDNYSIYGDEDEVPVEKEENDCIHTLIEDEYEAIDGYNKAISEIMKMDLSDTIKKGIITDLEEIRKDEFEHVEKLKRIKVSFDKKEEKEIVEEQINTF